MDKDKTQIDFEGDLEIMDLDTEEQPDEGQADFTVPEGKQEQPYTGPERRRGERRKTSDRRQDIRFEPDKPDRRSGKDRRKGTWDIKYRI